MRPIYVTLAAITLLGTAPIFGQAQNDTTQSNTAQAEQDQAKSQDNQGKSDENETPAKGMLAACKKMASDKKLSGDAKKEYIKECQEGKKTREGH